MSYTKHFSKRIKVPYKAHYSGSVSYPASQNGGSKRYDGIVEGYTEELLEFDIEVDTNEFDSSIDRCNKHVNTLTGSVVAAEAAEIASITACSHKVGQTIVDGFFKTVRSELSQQMTELKSRIDASLINLKEYAARVVAMKSQMGNDYGRLASRYVKLFEDLDSELKNRIFELDKPTFQLVDRMAETEARALGGELVAAAAISGGENAELSAQISASYAKRQALGALGAANRYLTCQQKLDSTLSHSMLRNANDGCHFVPICLTECSAEDGSTQRRVFRQPEMQSLQEADLQELLLARQWNNMSDDERGNICRAFNDQMAQSNFGADAHSERVRECIMRMFDGNQTQSL